MDSLFPLPLLLLLLLLVVVLPLIQCWAEADKSNIFVLQQHHHRRSGPI